MFRFMNPPGIGKLCLGITRAFSVNANYHDFEDGYLLLEMLFFFPAYSRKFDKGKFIFSFRKSHDHNHFYDFFAM